MTDSTAVLARLRTTGPGSPVARLAALAVDDVLARPLADLVDAALVAETTKAALASLTASDGAAALFVARAVEIEAALAAETRTFTAIIPAPLRAGLQALAEVPVSPRREAVVKLLDREPLKQMLRGQIVATLADFGRKAASPMADSAIARGIGGFSKMALGQLGSRPNPLGRVANAVSNEVERQVDKRASDFADTAVAGVLEGIADQVSDPARTKEQAAVRASLVAGLLESTGADLADLIRGHAPAHVAAARTALGAWAAEPSFVQDVQGAVEALVAREAGRSLGDVLADLAIGDAVASSARAVVERELQHLVAGGPFGQWLTELLADP